MRTIKSIAVASIVLCASAATAQTFKEYGMAGDWQIAINENMGPGCLAIQKFSNPTSQVQMGIDATSDPATGYIAIYVEAADGIAAGEEVPASLDLNGDTFEGTFIGQQTDGMGGAFVPVNNTTFIDDLAAADSLTVTYGEGYRVIVDLTDSDAAIQALRACQDAQ